jgi:hypothetical protein
MTADPPELSLVFIKKELNVREDDPEAMAEAR